MMTISHDDNDIQVSQARAGGRLGRRRDRAVAVLPLANGCAATLGLQQLEVPYRA